MKAKIYEISFGIHLMCKIKVTDNQIEVEAAVNGWGDGVPLEEITIKEIKPE